MVLQVSFPPKAGFPHGTLQNMSDALAHRGPDGEGYYHFRRAIIHTGLAHRRRLACIDLSDAAGQPFRYMDRYVLVYNGEIYNYREIREH